MQRANNTRRVSFAGKYPYLMERMTPIAESVLCTSTSRHPVRSLVNHHSPELLRRRQDEAGEKTQIAPAQVTVFVMRQIRAKAVDVIRHRGVDRAVGFERLRHLGHKTFARQLGEMAEEQQIEIRRQFDRGQSEWPVFRQHRENREQQ